MTIDKKLVIKELQNYLETDKLVGVLSANKRLPGSKELKTCFCIEGVFCDAASVLGYDGKFITESDKRSRVFIHQPVGGYQRGTKFRCNAPQQVYSYLGIPYVVPLALVREAGLAEKLHPTIYFKTFFRGAGEAVSWDSLNDKSSLTLKELLSFTCNLLEKRGPTKL